MIKKKMVLLLLVLVVVCWGGWSFWQQNYVAGIPGKLEQEIVPHYSEVSGKLIQMNVQLGQSVEKGEVLAVLDNRTQQYNLEQLKQVLVQKQADLEQLLNGAEPAAIQQARNAVHIAQSTYSNAQLQYDSLYTDWEKATALYEIGGLSQQEYDRMEQSLETAQNNLDVAANQVDSAQQQVVLISGNADKAAVKAAQAAVAQVESQIAQAKEQLEKYTIQANCSGTVISVNYTTGAMVNSGGDLVEIANRDQAYLLAYWPVEKLSEITYGQSMTVLSKGEAYQGEICFIDVKAQYTPQEFQSAVQKEQERIKIKLKMPAAFPLQPGQMAQIPLDLVV